MSKYEGREVVYPTIMKVIQQYFGLGILDLYFAIEEELNSIKKRKRRK